MQYFTAKQDLLTACGFEYHEAEEQWVCREDNADGVVLPIERFTKWSHGDLESWLREHGFSAVPKT